MLDGRYFVINHAVRKLHQRIEPVASLVRRSVPFAITLLANANQLAVNEEGVGCFFRSVTYPMATQVAESKHFAT